MGDNSTSSTSTPLTGAQRGDIFTAAMYRMNGDLGSAATPAQQARFSENYNDVIGGKDYQAQTFQELGNGDYDRMEQNIYDSATSGLGRQEQLWRQQADQSLADRGIWSSGVAQRAQGDVTERLAPQYAKAGADAALARYTLQNTNTAAKNAFNQAEADKQWNSKWRPLEYLQGVWNGTGGAISTSSGGGWSI